MRTSLKIITITASAAFMFAACSVEAPKNSAGTPSSSSKSNAPPAEEKEDGTKPFGSKFTWEDSGLAVTVGKPSPVPEKYTADLIAYGGGEGFTKFVVMDVIIDNVSKEPKETFEVTMNATTGEKQSPQVFYEGAGLSTAAILPGKSLTSRVAFGVDEGAPFVVSVQTLLGDRAFYQ